MATSYKTPGVYVEEIPKLPPSVAEVETAIPAFIGYTQRASHNGDTLFGKAFAVESLADYEASFGQGPSATYTAYLDSASDRVTSVLSSQPYYLYDSIRQFFDNGGGRCYVIAVAAYQTSGTLVDGTLLNGALAVLEKEDEPTLIVCPDAALLSSTGLYDFQKLALAQAAKLGDRFVICDTLPSDETVSGQTFAERVQAFRDNIGISNLKYGAAYGPYLRSSIPRSLRYREISLVRGAAPGTPAALESLTSDNGLLQLIFDLKNAKTAVDSIAAIVSTTGTGILTGTSKTFEDQFKTLLGAVATALTESDRTAKLIDLYAFTVHLVSSLKGVKDALPAKAASTPVPANAAQTLAFVLGDEMANIAKTTGADKAFATLLQHAVAFGEGTPANQLVTDDPTVATTNLGKALAVLGIAAAGFPGTIDPAITALYSDPATDATKNVNARNAVVAGMGVLLKFWYAVQSAAQTYEKTFDDSLEGAFGTWKQIKASISASAGVLPPSGAVAGIYARVDSARGVWKAPANESFNSVIGPVVQINADQQASLNVDAVAGKSINAIRAFTGKGTLIWGARTLAGNDNEWRYVNVRRFFNMVEESCKKATEPFVFESNDATTWIKVQGMIENFLTLLWRQGALQGAKPEQAFYVAVGLGKTMTSVDILEGRMIVEIGMAAVRPAEFIVLRFSHKLAEA